MITLLFSICLVVFIFKLVLFALKATWGITKVVFAIILFPAFLIVMAVSGLMVVAFPALIIAGIVLIVKKLTLGV